MIKGRKSNKLFSIFIDFSFLMLFFGIIYLGTFFFKFILFNDESYGGIILIETEILSEEYKNLISVGDSIYDTLTKRKIGNINSFEIAEEKEGFRFIISTDAKYIPKSNALRTSRLWFEYSIKDE